MWRKTPQTILIRDILSAKCHATNQELAAEARKTFPTITNTTVHRITARLIDSNMAAYAPSLHHIKVIDANPHAHDHFLCKVCNKLVDIKLSDETFSRLQQQLPSALSRHSILVAGICKKCEQ
jgi:Fur family peroxide stress response transcriptional regulator